METKNIKNDYDVIIIGGGTSGMGAAYALKGKGYKVAVIEQLDKLGGTACNSWVETWIEALIPPYIENVFEHLPNDEKSGILDNAWLPTVFAGKSSNGLYMNGNALSKKYEEDLSSKDIVNIDIFTKTRFVKCLKKDKRVEAVIVTDLRTDTTNTYTAEFFIDASADGVLCRSAGADYFCGRDRRDLYGESIASEKELDKIYLNEPSLFFKLEYGFDDSKTLDNYKTVYYDGNKIYNTTNVRIDGYKDVYWVNPMTGCGDNFGDDGKTPSWIAVLKNGFEETQRQFEERIIEYWKYVKLKLKVEKKNVGAWTQGHLEYGYAGEHAPFLGIRETYRIKCIHMLNQNELTKLISSKKIEHYIAEGSHGIDFHIPTGLNMDELDRFNGRPDKKNNPRYPQLRPYGIPYESTVPHNLENVLVCSRCFGASQVALASARVNMVMAQLGWAVGNAIRLCLDERLSDVYLYSNDILIKRLQSSDYTDFKCRVEKLEKKYNDILKSEIENKNRECKYS